MTVDIIESRLVSEVISPVAQDLDEALKWFRLAADQGNADAQLQIGLMYEDSRGVAKDLNEAMKWYGLAAAQGNQSVIKRLAKLKMII